MKTVVKMKFGSHLYGTNTPSSDTDFKGVHIPDARDILMGRTQEEITAPSREKVEGERNQSTDVDDKSYSLKKFFKLAAEGQTVAIDMLFAPDEMLIQTSALWRSICSNRHKLLTKKSASFLGYCRDQANKYGIKGSRVAAAQAASDAFEMLTKLSSPQDRLNDVPNGVIMNLIEDHPEYIKVLNHPVGSNGKLGAFLEVCGRKVALTAPVRVAAEVFTKIHNEYGDRAKKAQSNEGVDWKALSHAVRVGEEAIKLLHTGNVTLPLHNADHIRRIKLGELPYTEVAEEIERLLADVEVAAAHSVLPEEVDQKFIDETILLEYAKEVSRTYKFSEGAL